MGKKEQPALTPKPIIRVFIQQHTAKAFAVEDNTAIKDVHAMMIAKLELAESEGKFFEVVERWNDEPDTDVKLGLDETVNKILARWESEKKKKKKEPAFYWRENEEKAKQGKHSIRVYFRDNSFKAITIDGQSNALQLQKLVAEKIELTSDTNFGLFDKRRDSERPLPPIENMLNVMADWKKNAKNKKEVTEDDGKFVFKLKTDFREETLVDDPIRAHLLYLEARATYLENDKSSADDCVKLAALELQINFGDYNTSVHTAGYLLNKFSELLPKKLIGTKKPNEWESIILNQFKTHKGMAPLAAKLEFLAIVNPNFRASASIVAINKAEQAREALQAKAPKKKVATTKPAEAPAPPTSSSGGPPPPPPPPPTKEKIRAPGEFPTREQIKSTKAVVSNRFQLLQSIEEGTKLKKTETVDKSGPVIEKVKIKKMDRDGLLKAIEGGVSLKSAEEVKDRSAPQIAEDAKVKKSDRPDMLQEIEQGKKLKHTETKDKSAPVIKSQKVDPNAVMQDIEKGVELIKITYVRDHSAPKIDKSIKIKKIDREGLLKGIEEGIELKHADTVDKSAPVLPTEKVAVKKNDRDGLMKAIEGGVQLKKTS